MSLGNFIKSKALLNNMSLRDLANKMGISVSLLSFICAGKRNLTKDNRDKLIYFLELDEIEIKELDRMSTCKNGMYTFDFVVDEKDIIMVSMFTVLKDKYSKLSKKKMKDIINILED